MNQRKMYGVQVGPDRNYKQMLDYAYKQTKAAMNQRTDEQRTIDAKIARLRLRVKRLADNEHNTDIVNVLLGILDLLDEEL